MDEIRPGKFINSMHFTVLDKLMGTLWSGTHNYLILNSEPFITFAMTDTRCFGLFLHRCGGYLQHRNCNKLFRFRPQRAISLHFPSNLSATAGILQSGPALATVNGKRLELSLKFIQRITQFHVSIWISVMPTITCLYCENGIFWRYYGLKIF